MARHSTQSRNGPVLYPVRRGSLSSYLADTMFFMEQMVTRQTWPLLLTLASGVTMTMVILIDLLSTQSMVTQYIHWVAFAVTMLVAATGLDYTIVLIQASKRSPAQRLKIQGKVHHCLTLLGYLAPFHVNQQKSSAHDHRPPSPASTASGKLLSSSSSSSTSLASFDSPSKPRQQRQQDRLPDEVEVYVQTLLDLYVLPWARAVSPNQTLDKELQNDLRRVLYELVDRLKRVDARNFSRDMLRLLTAHALKVREASKTAKCLAENFHFHHPVFTDRISKEAYLFSVVQRLFMRHGVQRSISTRIVFACLCNIVSTQLLLNLSEALSKPENCKYFLELLLYGKGGSMNNVAKQLSQSNEKTHSLKLTLSPTSYDDSRDGIALKKLKNSSKLWHSESRRSCKVPQTLELERSLSEKAGAGSGASNNTMNSPKQKERIKKTTLDLTGYSVREEEELVEVKEPQSSGKISNALGGLFSATAGPLLPDNIAFKSFNKMWKSKSNDNFQDDPSHPTTPSSNSNGNSTTTSRQQQDKQGSPFKLFSPVRRKQSMPSTEPLACFNQSSTIVSPQRGLKKSANLHSIGKRAFLSQDDSNHISADIPFDNSLSQIPLSSLAKEKLQGLQRRHSTVTTSASGGQQLEPQPDSKDSFPIDTEDLLSAVLPNLNSSEDFFGSSPAYEDHEDLESAISKLRALLTEREHESSSTTDTSSNDSFTSLSDPPEREAGTEGGCRANVLEARDLPSDGRLILHVRIPETEVYSPESGIAGEDSLSLASDEVMTVPVYCIHYDGIYLEPVSLPGSPGSKQGELVRAKDSSRTSSYRYIVQKRVVKRRFKEFLHLQDRLESNQRLKTALKGIRGPTKWLNLPFTKTSEQHLETRRLFLEKWLVMLCDQPALVVSSEIRDFMAYGDDGTMSFFQKGEEGENLKIDKFLVKTVSGVFHSIRDALPSFDDESPDLANLSHLNSHNQLLMPVIYSPSKQFHSLPVTSVDNQNMSNVQPQQQQHQQQLQLQQQRQQQRQQRHSQQQQQQQQEFVKIFGNKKGAPGLPYQLNFIFSSSSGELSIYENTLEFLVQRYDQRLKIDKQKSLKKAITESKMAVKSIDKQVSDIRFICNPMLQNEDDDSLSLAVIEFLISILPKSSGWSNVKSLDDQLWLGKEISIQMIHGLLKEILDSLLEQTIDHSATEEAWIRHLKVLRNVIWDHQTMPQAGQESSDQNEEAKRAQFKEMFSKVGLNDEKCFAHLLQLTSSRKVNEELVLNFLDLTASYLTNANDDQEAEKGP